MSARNSSTSSAMRSQHSDRSSQRPGCSLQHSHRVRPQALVAPSKSSVLLTARTHMLSTTSIPTGGGPWLVVMKCGCRLVRPSELLIGDKVGHNFKHIMSDFSELQRRVLRRVLAAGEKKERVQKYLSKLQVSRVMHCPASPECRYRACSSQWTTRRRRHTRQPGTR